MAPKGCELGLDLTEDLTPSKVNICCGLAAQVLTSQAREMNRAVPEPQLSGTR